MHCRQWGRGGWQLTGNMLASWSVLSQYRRQPQGTCQCVCVCGTNVLYSKFHSGRVCCAIIRSTDNKPPAHTPRGLFSSHSCVSVSFSPHIIKPECSLSHRPLATSPTPLPAPCSPPCVVAHLQQTLNADTSFKTAFDPIGWRMKTPGR